MQGTRVDAPAFDGLRDESGSFLREIDEVIDELLDVFDVPCHRLDLGTATAGWTRCCWRWDCPPSRPKIDLFTGGVP